MPSISKIRYTNVIYENGAKRYIDNIFQFDGHNGILLLENGGGKTVFVQTLIQAVLPHKVVAGRKIQETLMLSNTVAHIAVEWILEDSPRRYALTAVSLFINSKDKLASYRFVNEYAADAKQSIENLPFVRNGPDERRAAGREEIAEYYRGAAAQNIRAHYFSDTDPLTEYERYLEENFKIIPSEWAKIATINGAEGGVEEYFNSCKTTSELIDRLLIPTVEESIAPDRAETGNGFVVLFEKQREHFQKQLQLTKRIEEMQGVIEELGQYNEVLRQQHLLEQSFTAASGELKSLHKHIQTCVLQREADRAVLEKRAEKIQDEQAQNEQSIAALQVAMAVAARDAQQTIYQMAAQRCSEGKLRLEERDTRLNNLEYARFKSELRRNAEVLDFKARELAQLDCDEEVVELRKQLTENSGLLKGCFMAAEAVLDEKTQQSAQAEKRAAALQTACDQELKGLRGACDRVVGEEGGADASVENCVAEQERIEREIFPDSINRDPKTQYALWQERRQQCVKNLCDYERNIAFYAQEKANYSQLIPEKVCRIDTLKADLQAVYFDLKLIETGAAAVKADLGQAPMLAGIIQTTTELYQRADTVVNQLGDEIVFLDAQYQQAMLEYRLAHRAIDDYSAQPIFTADAALTGKIAVCQGEFALLRSGAELFQQICRDGQKNPEELYAAYPLWASTLVTTGAELGKVMKRFAAFAGEFTQALLVLTEQEVREILDGHPPDAARRIVPSNWQNIMPERFNAWLGTLEEQARGVDQVKAELEERLRWHRAALDQVRQFYADHPFGEYRELSASAKDLENNLEMLQKQHQDLLKAQATSEEQLELHKEKKHRGVFEQEHLEFCVREAERYFSLQQEHHRLIQAKGNLRRRRTELEVKMEQVSKEKARQNEVCAELRYEQQMLRSEKSRVRNLKFYAEVQSLDHVYNDFTYDALAESRRLILDRLEGKQRDRGRIQAELEHAKADQDRLRGSIDELKARVETVLDESFEYPVGGAEKTKLLMKEMQSLKRAVQQSDAERERCYAQYMQAEGSYKTELQRYQKLYDELIEFFGDLSETQETLRRQKQNLARIRSETKDAMQTLHEQMARLAGQLNLLQRKNERFLFLLDDVPEMLLPTSVTGQDETALGAYLTAGLERTETLYEEVSAKREFGLKRKDQFVAYCEQRILAEQMRRKIVDGIRRKTSYDEFLHWHTVVCKNIHDIVNLAESERKEHYTHVEHMVSHINLYLCEICDGLKNLARKTRVRIEDTFKEIYVIYVPEWKDIEAKTRIRQYMDDITKRLDGDQYRDEAGKENYAEVRKALEKFLRTQQLLNQVLGENAVKVKCRKAASDQYITSRAFTWEESNQWSGGEKWSKNMALFLGCLNYLSEKRNYLKTTNRCTRVVIADNPFGKASSEHVLNPVFFIAKQLGFQVIALTAHDEGGFIRKYFPVIYSCRFAGADDKKTKIMQTDKEIMTAFFREHNPDSLARLSDYEEIGLF